VLYGNNDYEASCVDQWIDWLKSRCEQPAGELLGPVFGYSTFDQTKHDTAKTTLVGTMLPILNAGLEGKKWLVGNSISLADIIVGLGCLRLHTMIFTREDVKHLGNVCAWFDNVTQQPQVAKIIGEVKLCQSELPPGALKH